MRFGKWVIVSVLSCMCMLSASEGNIKVIDGKIWQDQPETVQKKMTWPKAEKYCKNLKIDYYGKMIQNFRLPTIQELKRVMGKTCPLDYRERLNYWSSELEGKKGRWQQAHSIMFFADGLYDRTVRIVAPNHVRCVKDASPSFLKWYKSFKSSNTPQALQMRYGEILVKSAKYDKESQQMTLTLVSEKTKEGARTNDLKKNLIEHPLLSTDGSVEVVRIEDVDTDTSLVELVFHKYVGDYNFVGFYVQKLLYLEFPEKKWYEESPDHSFYIRGEAHFKLYFPRLQKTFLEFPRYRKYHFFADRLIMLNNTPAFQTKLIFPVDKKYAGTFKTIVLSKTFRPKVRFENGGKKVVVDAFKTPDLLVMKQLYDDAGEDLDALKRYVATYPESPLVGKARKKIAAIEQKERERAARLAAEKKEREAKAARRAARERKAYQAKKQRGDLVCMNGKMFLLSITVKGYVENISGDKIQIRIADTEGTTPRYKGVSLRQNTIIWDDYYRWKRCE